MRNNELTAAEQQNVLSHALAALALNFGATRRQVKSAYRKMAMKYHPDKGGSNEQFNHARQAYDFLCKYGTKKKDVPVVEYSFGGLEGFGHPFAGGSFRVVYRRTTG